MLYDATNPKELLAEGLQQLNLTIDIITQRKLLDYLRLMRHWNKTYNLTAVIDEQQQIILHVLDSLSVVPYIRGKRLLDVGSGPGLPGIPLALCCPELQVLLLEVNQKKASFMRQVQGEFPLCNVEVLEHRLESLELDFPCSTIISRAFSKLSSFVEKTLNYGEGTWLTMKGAYPAEELSAFKELFPSYFVECIPLTVPFLQARRYLIRVVSQ